MLLWQEINYDLMKQLESEKYKDTFWQESHSKKKAFKVSGISAVFLLHHRFNFLLEKINKSYKHVVGQTGRTDDKYI